MLFNRMLIHFGYRQDGHIKFQPSTRQIWCVSSAINLSKLWCSIGDWSTPSKRLCVSQRVTSQTLPPSTQHGASRLGALKLRLDHSGMHLTGFRPHLFSPSLLELLIVWIRCVIVWLQNTRATLLLRVARLDWAASTSIVLREAATG